MKGQDSTVIISYDVRDRGTDIESNLDAAKSEIDRLSKQVQGLSEEALSKPVQAVFILSAEGEQQQFQSTLGRELGFATHHAIHHNALIKAIASSLAMSLPQEFGLAPSTANYNKTHGI